MSGKYLIDTQCFLWHFAHPERLNERARSAMTDSASELWLSIASGWEITIKHALGKLPLPEAIRPFLESRLAALSCKLLAVEIGHLGRLAELPQHHRDPFDRMIIAQALANGLVVITADPKFVDYEVPVLLVNR